jgi:uncharacterized protein with HEPN domain
MSRHDPEITLSQIAENARRAVELCAQNPLSEIVSDWQKCLAFERAMEIIGEAAKRLPPELTTRYSDVDWRGIAGMRDRVSHGYDSVDYDLLWQAVKNQMPGLLAAVEKMLRDLNLPS